MSDLIILILSLYVLIGIGNACSHITQCRKCWTALGLFVQFVFDFIENMTTWPIKWYLLSKRNASVDPAAGPDRVLAVAVITLKDGSTRNVVQQFDESMESFMERASKVSSELNSTLNNVDGEKKG